MRDATIIKEFQELYKQMEVLMYHVRLISSGEALFDETIKTLLLKKGIITEVEFKETLGEIVTKVNSKESETPKPQTEDLITPSPSEVAKIEETKKQ